MPTFTQRFPPLPLLYFRLVISALHSIKMPPSKRSLFFRSKHFFVGFVPKGKTQNQQSIKEHHITL